MYLSKIPLDLTKSKTLLALTSPSIFHGAIESSFSGERKRNLWRIDELNHQKYLLLLSQDKPDFQSIERQFSPSGEHGQAKDYSKLLNRVQTGTVWKFRLCTNPTYNVTFCGKRKKRLAHLSDEGQLSWLKKQAEKNGFSVKEGSICITQKQWYQFSKGNEKHKINMLLVTYDGVLKVTDSNLFVHALTSGIGREKAYGAGLLTLVSLRN